ncbi:ABC-type antimicrobial peptide transport system, permease component [Weissella oryzae SG25]|uniref:ABC-type antimicrobial peptide transport system, permease component n=1 Tax=Weissella oryzae (strain DSM 25784 / JCM 18191 / LMG 30913 / SG25) TaxID=1329250 RepID=A0A069CVV9_WEIOS|nr:hypothetical protein [Weissella oryzae]GAK31930.1 ABC-type antimicrobial peptide transport system, permease component [Weissella oryzae SG25]
MLKLNKFLGVVIVIIASIFLLQSSVSANNNDFAVKDSSKTIGDISNTGGEKSELNNNENSNKKSLPEAKADDKGLNKKEVIKHYSSQDMDYINEKMLSNYKPYHQEPDNALDFSTNAAHVLADLFSSINRDLVYVVFDKALSLLFNLTNVQNSTNSLFNKTSKFNGSFWNNEAFKNIVYIAFGVGILWAFIMQAKNHGGIKSIAMIIAFLIFGSAWIAGGGAALQKVNNLTSTAEVTAFQATSSVSSTTQVNDFQQALRFQYFQQAIERSFYLENFNKTKNENIDTKKMGDPIDFIRGAVETSDDIPDKNPNMNKDGKKSWYQVMIALISPVTSIAYGIPLFTIGLFNIGLQFLSVALYFFAPFAILISLLPKYATSGIKTALAAVAVLLGKIFLVFGIMLLNWIQGFSDAVIPPTDSGSAILNAALYIVLILLLWKNKGRIFGAITGSRVVENVAEKAHVRKPINEMKQQYDKAKRKVWNGRRRVNKARKKYNKFKKRFEDDEDDPETPRTPQRHADPDETKRAEQKRQAARKWLDEDSESHGQHQNYRTDHNGVTVPNNSRPTTVNYGKFGGNSGDYDEAKKANMQRRAARSFVLKKTEYDGSKVTRNESKKRRTNRVHEV